MSTSDPSSEPSTYVPDSTPVSSPYYVTYAWDNSNSCYNVSGVKYFEQFAVYINVFLGNELSITDGKVVLNDVTADNDFTLRDRFQSYTNPHRPSVFGQSFTSSINLAPQTIAPASSVLGAMIQMHLDPIDAQGTYLVEWAADYLVSSGSLTLAIKANAESSANRSVLSWSAYEPSNQWKHTSGFALTSLDEGDDGLVSLTYSVSDATSAVTVRNTRLVVLRAT